MMNWNELYESVAEYSQRTNALAIAPRPVPNPGSVVKRWDIVKSYSPDICNMLISHVEDGKSVESFCGANLISPSRFAHWLSEQEDLRESMRIALSRQIGKLEESAQSCAETGNTEGLRFAMFQLAAATKRNQSQNFGGMLLGGVANIMPNDNQAETNASAEDLLSQVEDLLNVCSNRKDNV